VTAGRNDPCPCGSGLKYKKCHLPLEEAEARAAEPHRAPAHDAGFRLIERIGNWAYDRFGSEFKAGANDFGLNEVEGGQQFGVPWMIFHHPLQGMPAYE
jgi:hypothetical protein